MCITEIDKLLSSFLPSYCLSKDRTDEGERYDLRLSLEELTEDARERLPKFEAKDLK